jgi:hypothetical protein
MLRRIAPIVALTLGLALAAPAAAPAFAAPTSAPASSAVTAPVTPAKLATYHTVPKAAFDAMPAKAKRILRRRSLLVRIAKKRIVKSGPAGRVVKILGPGRPIGYKHRGKWYYPRRTVVTVWLSTPPVPKYVWRPAVFSVFGGPSENQSVAGPYPTTGAMDARGMPYFAHKTMPFGTRVLFRDSVGHTVIGFCADRGPYAGNREFDLSPNIANRLGLGGTGTIMVSVLK